jgi:hypothetical protein
MTDELKTEREAFRRSVTALLRKVQKYATEGGDHLGAGSENTKLEHSFYKSRDKLEQSMRRLGLTDDVDSLALMLRLKVAVSAARDLATEARRAKREIERKALDEKGYEARRWRIENGLEDPPKLY